MLINTVAVHKWCAGVPIISFIKVLNNRLYEAPLIAISLTSKARLIMKYKA